MASNFRSTTIARLFAGIAAAAALAIVVPAFAETTAQPSGAVIAPADKPAVPTTGTSTDAKAPAAALAKSSDAGHAGAKEKTKVAADETGAVKHHHKVAKTEKPTAEKTETPAATGAAGK